MVLSACKIGKIKRHAPILQSKEEMAVGVEVAEVVISNNIMHLSNSNSNSKGNNSSSSSSSSSRIMGLLQVL